MGTDGYGVNVENLLIRVESFLRNQQWSNALKYCDRILDEDVSQPMAYVYQIMAKNKISDYDDLDCLPYFITDYDEYSEIESYADDDLIQELKDCNARILENKLEQMQDLLAERNFNEAANLANYIMDYYPEDDAETDEYKDECYRTLILAQARCADMDELKNLNYPLSELEEYNDLFLYFSDDLVAEMMDAEQEIRDRILDIANKELMKETKAKASNGGYYMVFCGDPRYINSLANESYYKDMDEAYIADEEREYCQKVSLCKFLTDAGVSDISKLKYYERTHDYNRFDTLQSYEQFVKIGEEEAVEQVKKYAEEIDNRLKVVAHWQQRIEKKRAEINKELGKMEVELSSAKNEEKKIKDECAPLRLRSSKRKISLLSDCGFLIPQAILVLIWFLALFLVISQIWIDFKGEPGAYCGPILAGVLVIRVILIIVFDKKGLEKEVASIFPVITLIIRMSKNGRERKLVMTDGKAADVELQKLEEQLKEKIEVRTRSQDKVDELAASKKKFDEFSEGKRICSELYKTILFDEKWQTAQKRERGIDVQPLSEEEILSVDLYETNVINEAKKYFEDSGASSAPTKCAM